MAASRSGLHAALPGFFLVPGADLRAAVASPPHCSAAESSFFRFSGAGTVIGGGGEGEKRGVGDGAGPGLCLLVLCGESDAAQPVREQLLLGGLVSWREYVCSYSIFFKHFCLG